MRVSSEQELWLEVAKHLPQVMIVAEYPTGRPLFTSPQPEHMFGMSAEEMRSDPQAWLRVVEPEDLPKIEQARRRLAQGTVAVEYRVHHPQRGLRWLRSTTWLAAATEHLPDRVIGIVEDVTEARALQREMMSAVHSMRSLVERLPMGVLVFDERLPYANQTMLDFLGVQAKGVLGRPVRDLITRIFSPTDAAASLQRIDGAADGTLQPAVERLVRRADGAWRTAEVTTMSVQFDGQPASLTIFRDLTEQRMLQEQLAKADQLALRGRMAEALAHELNSPLAVLAGNVHLAQEQLAGVLSQLGPLDTVPAELVNQLTSLRDTLLAAQEATSPVRRVMREFRELPTREASVRTPIARRRLPAQPSASKRGSVLIIDDDPLVGDILQRALAASHDVEVLTDARTALQHLLAGPRRDAILCDVMMPHLSGLELYQQLAAQRPDQAEHLIFITGGAFADDADAQLQASGRPRLEKPFEIAKIRSIVGQMVG